MVFPDPLQCAYQKKLSSLNATYSIQETINYNTGSKVFMCLMDNKKAFDIVWHNGLFVKLYKLGICNKLWKLIINAYTGIVNTVLYDGIESDPFKISQSTRQGSMWGAFFYLVFANSLIEEIRELDSGAYVHNIFSGIHMQADDIALLSTSRRGLQIMMDRCYLYSCKRRFIIHPGKSVIMVCAENKQKLIENKKIRTWQIGSQTIDEVTNHEHCGILLSNGKSTVIRTKTACRKGRGIMSSLCRQDVLGQGDMNPLTYLKLYKTITLTSALFGCELWHTLSKTEKNMLERMQRYCAKIIQKFSRRTRSNICCKMLGLQSIESCIDAAKLKFWRRLNDLPSYAISKQIFMQRLFQAILMPGLTNGFSEEILHLCSKYSIKEFLDSYTTHAMMPDKIPWKNIIRLNVTNFETTKFVNETEHDPDFKRFNKIHPDPLKPSPVWQVARDRPHMRNKCYTVSKLIAYPSKSEDQILCEYCGIIFQDSLVHYVNNCCAFGEERDKFWDILSNTCSIELSAGLYNLDDDSMTNVLLGGPWKLITEVTDHIDFMCISINFLFKLMSKVNLFIEP